MARYYCNKCRGRYRCTCASSAKQAFATETVNKVITIPVEGEQGVQGDVEVSRFAKTLKTEPAPAVNQVPSPAGWSTTKPMIAEDEQLWEITAVLNWDRTKLVTPWSPPVSNISGIEPLAPESASDIFG